ncbi:uncharacterized protein BDW47DRAFT_106013 [Aspergillus candidus]|uniref:Uncharacterized protein n=1 Tax=Aspergillus candidus TaxID=41067 RepID=A0A2I2FB96_ASPCN|nr:hypothetical protein BDW47DRAFT_106013 [Aspergillus candidus]PLB37898.1 hypothetical protein BDW47DRAFT_106013 [Aspergillus candidus]
MWGVYSGKFALLFVALRFPEDTILLALVYFFMVIIIYLLIPYGPVMTIPLGDEGVLGGVWERIWDGWPIRQFFVCVCMV